MYMFDIFLLNVNLFCFIRQLPLNFTNMFLPIYSSFGITNFFKIFAHRLEY